MRMAVFAMIMSAVTMPVMIMSVMIMSMMVIVIVRHRLFNQVPILVTASRMSTTERA